LNCRTQNDLFGIDFDPFTFSSYSFDYTKFDYPDYPDNHEPVAEEKPTQEIKCGGTINESTTIFSPGFEDGNYPNNLDCKWYVRLETVAGFNIIPRSFEVCSSWNCKGEYVHVNAGTVDKTFCGKTDEKRKRRMIEELTCAEPEIFGFLPILIRGGDAEIRFATDGSNYKNYKGFELEIVALDESQLIDQEVKNLARKLTEQGISGARSYKLLMNAVKNVRNQFIFDEY
jgi:hypothetical protein